MHRQTVTIRFAALAVVLAHWLGGGQLAAQTPTSQQIRTWVKNLDSPRFATRVAATRKLTAAGAAAISHIQRAVNGGSLETISRGIRILSQLALHKQKTVSRAAQAALKEIADAEGTAAARRADETLRAIARTHQRTAIAKLSKLGAIIGEPSQRELGIQLVSDDPYTIRIGRGWQGTPADLKQLQEIYDARVVILEGRKVDDEWLMQIGKLKRIEVLIIKRGTITDAGVGHLAGMTKLRQLTIKYCGITNRAIDNLAKLEWLSLVKIYGTKMTAAGVKQLRGKLAFSTIDFRRGAFLGVACVNHPRGCYVTLVQSSSSAERAGMRVGDVIIQYGGKPVKGFADLTKLISAHKVGDKTEVVVMRNGFERKLHVTLGEWD